MKLVLATHCQSLINILHLVNRCLDIDDSDLLLAPIIRPTNNTHIVPQITTTQTLFSSQNNQVDNCVVKLIRRIPGPAGIVQTAKLRKLVDTREGGEESVIAIDYVNVDGGIVTGCFGDVKKFFKNEKLKKIVAVIKSCTPNALGDLTVTLKDLSGLDIDDSDLLLAPIIRPTNNTHIVPQITTTQTLFSSQNNQVDNCVVKPIRRIPGPAGIVQTAKLRKLVDTREGGEESVLST
nr:hypothetical protein [Tanacetum cinerariifolium]